MNVLWVVLAEFVDIFSLSISKEPENLDYIFKGHPYQDISYSPPLYVLGQD